MLKFSLLLLLTLSTQSFAGPAVIWGTPYPKVLSGGIQLFRSDTTTTCNAAAAGSMRYNAGTFEFCNGSAWAGGASLTNLSSSITFGANATYSIGDATNNVLTNHANGVISNSNLEFAANSGEVFVASSDEVFALYSQGATVSPSLRIWDKDGAFSASIKPPNTLAASYTLTLPVDDGASGEVLSTNGSGVLSWSALTASSVLASNGSAGTPSISFSGDPDTGLYVAGTNSLGVATAGAARYTFNGSDFRPAAASAYDLGTSALYWGTAFINLASLQAGWRIHSASFGTGVLIGAAGLTAPDGSTFTGIYGEGGATNNIGLTGGLDTSATAKGVIVQGQNSTDADAGGPIIIRGGSSASGSGGGIKFITPSTKVTCNSGNRGMYWHTLGGAGVKDNVEVCAKDASDAYAWRTIY